MKDKENTWLVTFFLSDRLLYARVQASSRDEAIIKAREAHHDILEGEEPSVIKTNLISKEEA